MLKPTAMCILAWSFTTPANAEQTEPTDTRAQLSALAFDPTRFFEDSIGASVLLRYRGDDYGWPVWSIAVQRRCEFQGQGKPCKPRHVARMVRAPGPQAGANHRPRWNGTALVGSVEKRVKQGADIVAAIDGAGIDWLEADVTACPAALAVLDRVDDVRWVDPGTIGSFGAAPGGDIVLHADTIEVTFPNFDANARYVGWLKPGSPARWGNDFTQALGPCWRPATAPAPWTKPVGRSVGR